MFTTLYSVPTEQYIGRFDRDITPHRLNAISSVDWASHPPWYQELFVTSGKGNALEAKRARLVGRTMEELRILAEFCYTYHEDDLLHLTFDSITRSELYSVDDISSWLNKSPILVYVVLKTRRANLLSDFNSSLLLPVVQSIIKSANEAQIAALVALQDLGPTLWQIPPLDYLNLARLTAMSIRSQNLVQEALLTLHEHRIEHCDNTDPLQYFHKNVLAVAFDLAEEAANECPCDNYGRPRAKVRATPIERLQLDAEDFNLVLADIRIDISAPVRIHSHVRLQASADPVNAAITRPILDGIVEKATPGQVTIRLFHPTPPEVHDMPWKLYTCGSVGEHTLPYSKRYFRNFALFFAGSHRRCNARCIV